MKMTVMLKRQILLIHRRNLGTLDVNKLRPELVLSNENRASCIEKLKAYKVPKRLDLKPVKKAAILAPLCTYNGELGFLYTLRSSRLSSNQGQVSFPGGMHDKTDANLIDTALRETWEELRIPINNVNVWTSSDLFIRKDVSVLPVLGYIGEIDPEKLNINTREVESAFVVTLKDLCDPSLCRFTQFRNNFTLPAYLGGKYRIWGLTAAITHMMMTTLVPNCYTHKITYLRPIATPL
ncbi:nucleoside diphosphate-linked moiety X motif 8 [Leptopilina heterotoma]|uniref:nucleoside diphosphate-linked moiety X motif 8 n=1 Tax=Leptopilina heterotoma TaxID=63436 RepID=UPI001CA90026|nr:nucleoside diphosphate-linked moiety X motif 8 [Leptopilina heterotoma]